MIGQIAQAEMIDLGQGTYHFFSGYYSSLVVIGDDSVLVTDPASDARAEEMKAEIAKLTDKPITHVVLSHEHYDHVGGTDRFDGAEIVCHVSCQKFFDIDVLDIAPEQVTLTFEDELSIELGNQSVELFHWGSGDGVATTATVVPSAGVAAIADMFEGPKSLTAAQWLDDKNVLGTRVILNRLAEMNLNEVIGGHSRDSSIEAFNEHVAFHNDLYDAVKAEIDSVIEKDGQSAVWEALQGSIPEKVTLPQYSDWQNYDDIDQHVFRMGMSIMHGG